MSRRVARATIVLISGLIALVLAASLTRAAEETPLDLRYGLYWAGFQIATLKLQHEVASTGYRAKLLIETVGLVEKLVHYRARTLAERRAGRRTGSLLPVAFSTEYRSRKKERRSIVTFDPASGDVVDVRDHQARQAGLSKVPEELRKDVVDPLTAFLRIREHVAAAGPAAPFVAQVFDGRRRYDLAARADRPRSRHGRRT